MVTVATEVLSCTPADGLLSCMENCLFPTTAVVGMIGTLKVWVATPGAKVRVPDTLVKFTPEMAVPFTVV